MAKYIYGRKPVDVDRVASVGEFDPADNKIPFTLDGGQVVRVSEEWAAHNDLAAGQYYIRSNVADMPITWTVSPSELARYYAEQPTEGSKTK